MENNQKQFISYIVAMAIISSVFGFLAGGLGVLFWSQSTSLPQVLNIFRSPATNTPSVLTSVPNTPSQEELIVKVVKDVSPAVVSIIATKDLPVIEQYYKNYNPFGDFFPFNFQVPEYRQKGTEKKEVGGGTGFIISSDGLVLTNKHVIQVDGAEYTVLTNDGEKYPARVLAIDPIQDIAILKIDQKNLPVVQLGDSDKLAIGQTVIAIGNALGEFRNTVSVGVISGLQRSVAAASPTGTEALENVIQTDAAINPGNSGGPLLNLSGEVVGINAAMAQGAQNIGFALPINAAKKDISQVKTKGKISYPFLGVRYVIITQEFKQKNNLSVDYGALLVKGANADEVAVTAGSPADKAGLQENDIILEVNGQKIDQDHLLAKIVQNRQPGDTLTLKVLSKGQEKTVKVVLGER